MTSKHAKNKDLLLVLGDFNAKTGSGHKLYPNNIAQYGKGHLNSNGEDLLEYTKENNLVLSNILFHHKLGHRTTRTSLERVNPHISVDGTVRRNPYRNQIDYIITKSIHRNLFLESKSQGNLSTITDHKLVKTRINLEWWRLKRQFKKSERLDVNRLRDPEMSQRYRKDLKTRLEVERQENERRDTTWKRIEKACKETARNTVGIKQFSKTQSSSLIVQELSLKQRKLKTDKESNQNKEQRRELNIERNEFLKQLKKELRNDNDKQLDLELQYIEKYKDDSSKGYQAIRKIQSHKPRKPLVIFDSELNRITSAENQVTVITDYFINLFSFEDKSVNVRPVKMEP